MLALLLSGAALTLADATYDPVLVERRIATDEARQGVASDGQHVYAIDNSRIGKYRIIDGEKVGAWEGSPTRFPHLNSCTIAGSELVCAASNYPAKPHASRVEFFRSQDLRHLRTHDFGFTDGSLTAIGWHAGRWWGTFAHYDGKGGIPGKGAANSRLVSMDRHFRVRGQWTFPVEAIARMRPFSASGASWLSAGLLAVSGHDRQEIYLLSVPRKGNVLRLEAIVPVATAGQAVDRDPCRPGRIWSISRSTREVVLSNLSGWLPEYRGHAARRCSSKDSATP